MSNLHHALEYAARGWPVLPLHQPTTRGCSCRACGECTSPGKHPRVARGVYAATIDPSQIRTWWRRWPNANIGIQTGATSGLVVIDIDPRHDGNRSLERLQRRHGPLRTLTVTTGSGGTHLYLAHPGRSIRNDNHGRLGPGIDIRGDGGYIVAPPSRHASGGRYSWVDARAAVTNLPPALLDALTRRPDRDLPRIERPGEASRYIDRRLQEVRAAAEGTRNATLNRAAYALGRLAHRGTPGAQQLEAMLIDAALAAGLTTREARATARSGLNAGLRRQPETGVSIGR